MTSSCFFLSTLYCLMSVGRSWYLFACGISVVTIVINRLRIVKLSKHSLCRWRCSSTYPTEVSLSVTKLTQCSVAESKQNFETSWRVWSNSGRFADAFRKVIRLLSKMNVSDNCSASCSFQVLFNLSVCQRNLII